MRKVDVKVVVDYNSYSDRCGQDECFTSFQFVSVDPDNHLNIIMRDKWKDMFFDVTSCSITKDDAIKVRDALLSIYPVE
ncbi:MAG: hypothetical protein P4L79_10520 [Legionella sp.]|uniref:hypothetical protein n=1 Tax=Legionella sp. TaxID=459 RepID=UPI0028449F97|nr:hypothetical protein [Legionella sp.]